MVILQIVASPKSHPKESGEYYILYLTVEFEKIHKEVYHI